MDIFEAIKGRRSCRKFLPAPISEESIEKILEAAIWSPSPANNQPWEFVVITNKDIKTQIYSEALRCKKYLVEKSGWRWMSHYELDFMQDVPVMIAVIGDPKKTGADMFLDGGGWGYLEGCAAASQNMLLASYALGLSTLWYTIFDKSIVKNVLNINPKKT